MNTMRLFSGKARRPRSSDEAPSSSTATATRSPSRRRENRRSRQPTDEQSTAANSSSTATSSTTTTTTTSSSISKPQFMILPLRLRDIDQENPECPICQEDYVIGCTIAYLPCGHLYHSYCINNWLARSSSGKNGATSNTTAACCLCRHELSVMEVAVNTNPKTTLQHHQESSTSSSTYCGDDDDEDDDDDVDSYQDLEHFTRNFQPSQTTNGTNRNYHNPLADTGIRATFRVKK